ncbi:hypothetical protein [Vibrio taketomensis]|uniref:hypothetical protein n=1 Tax=Vibrio taketomensis TaxID=2572923 RepID=UPI001389B2BC|nr:hypothetical protein [Vibrio taketomensis]
MYNKIIATLSLAFILTACGGGGGGDDSSSNTSASSPASSSTTSSASTPSPAPVATTPVPTPPAPAPANAAPAAAPTAQSNNLSSTYELTVDVALPQLSGKDAFIVICEDTGGSIDYNQCFVKASLRDGIGKFELLLPNHQQSLIAEVTPMEAGSNPLTFTWQYDNQAQSTWIIP